MYHLLSSVGPHDYEIEPVLFRKVRNGVSGIVVDDHVRRTESTLHVTCHFFIETRGELKSLGLDGLLARLGRLGVRGWPDDHQ